MSLGLSQSARRVRDVLHQMGLACSVVEFSDSTRTSAEAAQAVGCDVGQIAKSLVFVTRQSRKPVFVIASGSNRVDEKKLALLAGEKIEKADAEFVREMTGYAIGGVPPVGHVRTIETFIDEELLQYDEIWAAAGTPNAVFRLTPNELLRITGGSVAAVAR